MTDLGTSYETRPYSANDFNAISAAEMFAYYLAQDLSK
jgi:hypothetical protein